MYIFVCTNFVVFQNYMNVKLLRVSDNVIVSGAIKDKEGYVLPSFHDGWRFDFAKQTKRLSNAQTFVLVTDLDINTIEGCLIIQIRDENDPYMAYIEVAPHNQGKNKRYEFVAGCLIAYACRLSHLHAKGNAKGYLSFKVIEEKESDKIRLMTHYSKKYYAIRISNTNDMFIEPKNGQILIEEYLTTV